MHDITQMNPTEVTNLYHKHHGDLCITATSKQLQNKNKSSIPLYRKVGAAIIISLLSITGFNAAAQQELHKEDLKYVISTKESKDHQITIKGRIQLTDYDGEKTSSENIILRVFTRTENTVRQVYKIQLSKRGTFKIELQKTLLHEDFFISISEEEYLDEPIIIDHLPVKDIKLKGNLDKERLLIMSGRFF